MPVITIIIINNKYIYIAQNKQSSDALTSKLSGTRIWQTLPQTVTRLADL